MHVKQTFRESEISSLSFLHIWLLAFLTFVLRRIFYKYYYMKVLIIRLTQQRFKYRLIF